jgi:hypothetical protein
MAVEAIYGIRSIIFDKVVKGGFPSFDTSGTAFKVSAIVKDSFSFSDTAPSENNIEIEDSDEYFAVLNNEKGAQGFTFQSYDLSEEAYHKLLGFSDGTGDNEGYIVENPTFDAANVEFAVQITTRPLGEFSARQYEFARMKAKISKSGTLGKSGFPNLNIELTKLVNFDEQGNEHPASRIKEL